VASSSSMPFQSSKFPMSTGFVPIRHLSNHFWELICTSGGNRLVHCTPRRVSRKVKQAVNTLYSLALFTEFLGSSNPVSFHRMLVPELLPHSVKEISLHADRGNGRENTVEYYSDPVA
jgi:hypothetical protein